MVNKDIQRCSVLSVIREVLIKTIVKYHYTPVRMAKIKGVKVLLRMEATGTLRHCCW